VFAGRLDHIAGATRLVGQSHQIDRGREAARAALPQIMKMRTFTVKRGL
jgi:hypothetical protein